MSLKSINMVKIRLVDWYDLVMSLTRPSMYSIKEGMSTVCSDALIQQICHRIDIGYVSDIWVGYWYNCT